MITVVVAFAKNTVSPLPRTFLPGLYCSGSSLRTQHLYRDINILLWLPAGRGLRHRTRRPGMQPALQHRRIGYLHERRTGGQDRQQAVHQLIGSGPEAVDSTSIRRRNKPLAYCGRRAVAQDLLDGSPRQAPGPGLWLGTIWSPYRTAAYVNGDADRQAGCRSTEWIHDSNAISPATAALLTTASASARRSAVHSATSAGELSSIAWCTDHTRRTTLPRFAIGR